MWPKKCIWTLDSKGLFGCPEKESRKLFRKLDIGPHSQVSKTGFLKLFGWERLESVWDPYFWKQKQWGPLFRKEKMHF